MANEASVVDIVVRELNNGKWGDIHREKHSNQLICDVLSTASKRQTGNTGRPDIIIHDNTQRLLVLGECKALPRDHGYIGADIRDTAVAGVRHYIQHAWERLLLSNQKHDIIGIAVSGAGTARKITIIGICSLQEKENNASIKILYECHGKDIPPLEVIKSRLYAWDNMLDVKSINKAPGNDITSVPWNVLSNLSLDRKHQRRLDHAHVREISDTFSISKPTVLGVLIVAIVESAVPLEEKDRMGASLHHSYVLVDGQHRYEAYLQAPKAIVASAKVAVETIIVSSVEEAMKLYVIHYKGLEAPAEQKKPMSQITWPTNVLTPLLDAIENKWKTRTGGSFMLSRNAKVPQFLRKETEDALATLLIENRNKYESQSAEQLLRLIEMRNEELGKNPPQLNKKTLAPYSATTLKSCKDGGCWLGLVLAESWLL